METCKSNKQTVAMFSLKDARNIPRIFRSAETLAEDWKVVSICRNEHKGNKWSVDAPVDVRPINLISDKLPKASIFWPIKYFEFAVRCIVMGLQEKPTVCHGHEVQGAFPAWIVAKITKTPFVYDAHELECHRSGRIHITVYGKLLRKTVKSLLKRASGVICASSARADVMLDEYGITQRPTVIMNVTPQSGILRGPDAVSPFKEEIADPKIVIYQGVVTTGRGLDTLVDSLKYLPQNVRLLVVGDGAAMKAMEAIAISNSNQHRLYMVGRVPFEQVESYMRLADVGVVIYQNTCLNNYLCAPNKIFDYCSVGVPVVGSNFPEVEKIINEFEVGAVFDPESSESIASAIMEVLENNSKHDRMKENAIKVKNSINWEQQQDRLKDLYISLFTSKQGNAKHNPEL
ncbi:MAG: glycosyltransferase family 4 protein [bacterium]|nr:glycosyltransferase family 4 protein [bacterium]